MAVIRRCLVLLAVAMACFAMRASAQTTVTVGSKKFTEGYILAEIVAQLLEAGGFSVDRRFGLGGTLVCYEALRNGEIDTYPEYSGTLEQEIIKSPRRLGYDELARILRTEHGLVLLPPLGFDNTYAIALRRERALELGVASIGDLGAFPDLRYAFSHEFLNRRDGWPGLAAVYGLSADPVGVEHGLAYQALDEGKIDVTDVYSTDGDIRKYDLALLEDDRGYFPTYLAAPLVAGTAPAGVAGALGALAGTITADEMRAMNAGVLLDGLTFADVAAEFLVSRGLASELPGRGGGFWRDLARRTGTHLWLTLVALIAAILIAVPLGVVVYRLRRASKAIIYVTGVLQTVPSIALLAFMIPLLGIGATPAIVALFVYALLPILRNTTAALFAIDPVLKKVAMGMGLTVAERLRHVEIPLAVPTILAGVKTAAVINIGTATLAAFIGAGGLGEPIVTGLALNDTTLILEGAIPAAVLAILTELVFELIERFMVPRHLLQKGIH